MFAFINRRCRCRCAVARKDDWVARTVDRFMSDHRGGQVSPPVPFTEPAAAEADVIKTIRDALQAHVDAHGLRGAAVALDIPLGIVRATLERRDQKYASLVRLADALGIEIVARPKPSEPPR